MRWLAAGLLAAVFLRHHTAFWLAAMIGTTPPAVSYVMGGLLEVALGATVAMLLMGWKASPWRNLGIVAALIAASEGGQIAVCRMAIADIRALPANTTLCDHATGLPVAAVMTTLYLLAIAGVLARR